MNPSLYTRLSLLMFLQFFVWGAWFVTLGTYLNGLGFAATDIGLAYLTNNLGAIAAPFFVGMIADRFFASERVASLLHLFGGAVLLHASTLTEPEPIIFWLLVYNGAYISTLALANSIGFAHMANPDEQFPRVRVWGTVGWIVAGLSITFVLGALVENVEATDLPMKMAAACSVLLGVRTVCQRVLPTTSALEDATRWALAMAAQAAVHMPAMRRPAPARPQLTRSDETQPSTDPCHSRIFQSDSAPSVGIWGKHDLLSFHCRGFRPGVRFGLAHQCGRGPGEHLRQDAPVCFG